MTPLHPPASQPSDHQSEARTADPACRVSNVVPTGAVFAAALERLNRTSTISLFQTLTQEIDDHCRALGQRPGEGGGAQQAELLALLALLRQTTEQHRNEITLVERRLTELQALSAQSQAGFEQQVTEQVTRQVTEQVGRHIEQGLAPGLAAASAALEQKVAAVIERDLGQLGARLTKEMEARERARGRWCCIGLVLLALLLAGACFLVGLLQGRRSASLVCPPAALAPSAERSLDGRAGQSAMVPMSPDSQSSPNSQSSQDPKLKERESSGSLAGGAVVLGAADGHRHDGTEKERAVGLPDGTDPAKRAGAGSPAAAGKGPDSARSVDGSVTRSAVGAAPQAGSKDPQPVVLILPGSMEAQLAAFLAQPGGKTPRTFTMDRLQYPPGSHDMNAEGKEEVRALAQVLNAHPGAQIEIRGHNDGTESEVYTGPEPYHGYTLSQLRADCVYRRLQFLNVPGARMRILGLASSQPVADSRSEGSRQRNRRVEIVVLRK